MGGVALAATTIESGGAEEKMNEFIAFTSRD